MRLRAFFTSSHSKDLDLEVAEIFDGDSLILLLSFFGILLLLVVLEIEKGPLLNSCLYR